MEITHKEKQVLLLAARESIKKYFDRGSYTKIEYPIYPVFKIHAGAFVTLKIDSHLRGCIGYIVTKTTLINTVREAAKQAAFFDPRFQPLSSEEVDKIKIEISVLSPPQKINNYEEIIIGIHGLILEEENIRAILLPQVAVSHNFIREQFLSALCEKGGLPPDTWMMQKLNLQVFTANIFSDDDEYE